MSAILAAAPEVIKGLALLVELMSTISSAAAAATQISDLIKKAQSEKRDITQAELDGIKASLDDKARAHLEAAIAAATAKARATPV
jgi:hypothetical protein